MMGLSSMLNSVSEARKQYPEVNLSGTVTELGDSISEAAKVFRTILRANDFNASDTTTTSADE